MDYMEQERERGITITSAAITFHWNKHKINLIDTPGVYNMLHSLEQTQNLLDTQGFYIPVLHSSGSGTSTKLM